MIGAWVLGVVLAGAPIEVHTATRDVRDCRVIDQGVAAATEGGVVFVDGAGATVTTLTKLDGLPETRSHVIAPVSGSSTQLWVGTDGGLARIESAGRPKVLASVASPAPVRAVLEHDGHTYVGTWGAGMLELRGDRLRAIAGPQLSKAERVTDLVVHEDRVVVGSAGAGAWVLGEQPRPIAGIEDVVWSLAVHEGLLHAGTFVGVQRVEADGGVITLTQHDARALGSVDGALWIGSRGQGLARLGSNMASSLPASHVQGFDGDRCVATSEGLWVRDGRRWVAQLDGGLPSGDVTDVLQVGDRLYAATFDRGVAVYEHGRWTALADPDQVIDPQVNAIADAGKGRLWIATARGLHRAGPDGVETWTKKRGLPHHSVLSLATTRAGELVVGTHSGVAIVDARGDVRALGQKARRWATWAIAEAPDGELLLGTTQGLIRWTLDGSWEHLSMLSGHLSDNWVTALAWDGEALLVGSYAGGVDRLTRDGNGWSSEALGGGRINPGGLSVVDQTIYAATMKGVLERRGRRWVSSETQGVFEDATVVLDTNAGLWVASRRGLVRWPG